jgi:sterol 14-demethylase
VIVDRDLCQGHAVCAGEAPEIFKLGADKKVELLQSEPPPALHAQVLAAEKFCPTRAIRVKKE